MNSRNKKGQTGGGNSFGLVLGLVGGVASLAVVAIIAFTIVGITGGSEIIPQTTYTITNESFATIGSMVSVNYSNYTVNCSTYQHSGSFSAVRVWVDYNQSNGTVSSIQALPGGYNKTLDATNYTFDPSTGLLWNQTGYSFPNASIEYTCLADSKEIIVANNMTSNFSSGVQNISSKVPTVLLIGAIILIMGILAVLVGLWQRMRMGGGSL